MGRSSRRNKGHFRGKFIGLPYNLLDSAAWNDLSPRAIQLFLRLWRKFSGKNNGDLSLTLTELKKAQVLSSSATLTKALDELWSHGFIVSTREGSFGSARLCNLWAITTWPISDIPSKGIKASEAYLNPWRFWKPDQLATDYVNKIDKVKAKRQKSSSFTWAGALSN